MLENFGINIRRYYELSDNQEEVLYRFKKYQLQPTDAFLLNSGNDKVFIKAKEEASKWWSPELTLTIEASEKGSYVREVAGPNPATFTMTIFLLTVGVMILFLALMVALSQVSLGLSSTLSFLIAGFAAAFILSTYFIIWKGRQRAEGQIKILREFADRIIRNS